jgi:hypothetical protein
MPTQPTVFNATTSTTFKEPYNLDAWCEGLLLLFFNHCVDDQVVLTKYRGVCNEFKHMWT